MRRFLLPVGLVVVVGVVIALVVSGGSGSENSSATSTSTGTSAQSSSKQGGVLKVGLSVPVSDLDKTRVGTLGTVANLGLEGLMQQRPDGKAEPWLAEKVSRPDDLTFVYDLHQGVKFWDGNEMTSADVVASLDYFKRPKSLLSPYFSKVKSIEPTGKYQVTVKLKQPDARWQAWLGAGYVTIFEKKFQDEHGDKMGLPGTLIMGTGPWKFDSLDPNRGAELSANPNYWGPKKPTFGRISIQFLQDTSSLALAYRSNEIDVAPEINDPRGFEATSGTKLRSVGQCWLESFILPTTTAPWNDIHVRRAFAYAMNRQDLITARGVAGGPVTTPLMVPSQLKLVASPSEISSATSSLPQYPFNLEKAKQELAQSRYPKGFTAELPTVPQYFGDDPQVIAAQVAKIGIKLKVKNLPESTWFNRLSKKRNIPSVTWVPCATGDPSDLPVNYLSEGSVNAANYTKPAAQKLLDESITTYDNAKRFDAFRGLMTELATDVPYIPLFSQNAVGAISDRINWPTFSGNWAQRPWAMDITPKANS